MKAILMSIRPEYVADILNGDKTVEIRKGPSLLKAIRKLIDLYGKATIFAYCTKGGKRELEEIFDGHYALCAYHPESYKPKDIRGKVVAKFHCYNVEEIRPFEEYESPFGRAYRLTEDKILCCQKAQLTYDEYNHYLKGKTSTAIHISDLEIFDKPKGLWKFNKYHKKKNKFSPSLCYPCEKFKTCIGVCNLTRAPQSWCYVEVEE